MSYCTRCGRPLNDGEQCGRIQTPSPKRKNYTLLFAICIPVLCVFALVAGVLLLRFTTDLSRKSGQSRISEMNKAAAEMAEAANKALQRISDEGGDVSGWNNINSDEEIPLSYKFDIDRFRNYFSEYTSLSDKEYFIISRNGKVEYLAVSDSWNDTKDTIGTYPSADEAPVYFSSDGTAEKVGNGKRLRDVYFDGTRKLMDIRYGE